MLTEISAPAYPYQQFSDDADINALFGAYNDISSQYLSWILDRPLALYMRDTISGGLLDYSAYCIYGIRRLVLGTMSVQNTDGPIDSREIDALAIDDTELSIATGSIDMSDDLFKRIMTWNLNKGDGVQFSIPWLKKRVMRFITGVGGHAWLFTGTAPVSVSLDGNTVKIIIAKNTAEESVIDALNALLGNGTLQSPPNFSYLVSEAA